MKLFKSTLTIVCLLAAAFPSLSQECPRLKTAPGFVPPIGQVSGYLQSIIDPTYGTKITRITGDFGTAIPHVGGVWGRRNINVYATKQAWNADESLLYIHFGGLILDGQTYEVLYRRSPPDLGAWHPTQPNLMIYVAGNSVKFYNVRTNTSTTVVTIPGYSNFWQGYSEDNVSWDGKLVGVSAVRNSDNRRVGFVVDLEQKKKVSVDYDFVQYGYTTDNLQKLRISPTPTGKYVRMWGFTNKPESQGQDMIFFDYQGNEISRTWRYNHCPGHGGMGVTGEGEDVVAGRCEGPEVPSAIKNKTVTFNIRTGEYKAIGPAQSHTSTTSYKRRGVALGSSWGNGSVLLVNKLNGGATEYLANTYSQDPTDYWAQTMGSLSPSGTRAIFASNWGTGDLNDGDAHTFVVDFRDQCNVAPTPLPIINEGFDQTSDINFISALRGGLWQVAGGKLRLTNPAPMPASTDNGNLAIYSRTSVPTGDFTLTTEASAAATAGNWDDFSIAFNVQNADNYYFASFSESNNTTTSGIFRVSNGMVTKLADINTQIAGGASYAIKVEREASAIRIFLNDVQVASANDATLTGGYVGVGSKNNAAVFDNLRVVQ